MRYRTPTKGYIEDGIGFIPLSRGMVATVDADLLPDLEQHNWHACKGGNGSSSFYAWRRVKGGQGRVAMHRYVLGVSGSGVVVDHINHDTLDNRRSNLRVATPAQNGQNCRISVANKSGYKGVCWDSTNQKYLAVIRHNGKHIHLGRRATAEEAYKLYREAATRLHGEFACEK